MRASVAVYTKLGLKKRGVATVAAPIFFMDAIGYGILLGNTNMMIHRRHPADLDQLQYLWPGK